MVYTCLSLSQSQDGQSYSSLEPILIIIFVFSGLSWGLILLGEHLNDILQLNILTRDKNIDYNCRRKEISNGTVKRSSQDSPER